MNVTIYDHDPLAFSAIKGTDGNRVQVLDGESLLTLWLTEEQANALRQALDAIYPPASEADVVIAYAEEHAGDALTVHGRDQNGEPVTETIKALITIKAR